MKNIIIDKIYELFIQEGSIYTTLFGTDNLTFKRNIKINWIFNKSDLDESIPIILEHILSQIIQSYDIKKIDDDSYKYDNKKIIIYDNNKYDNNFIIHNYQIPNNVKFTDLENYLSDIQINENGEHIYFIWEFPIYGISEEIISF